MERKTVPAVVEAAPARGRVVAIMQPYLYPYLGYFRLLEAADVFVILDDVQFPRRGRVHRCELPGRPHAWLTLPLARQQRDVQIRELAFASGARARLDERLARLGWLAAGDGPLARAVRDQLHAPLTSPMAFLDAAMSLVADALRLPARRIYASTLGLGPEVRGQDRIIGIARAVGAETYVNAPGGRRLYASSAFAEAGLQLRFLSPYAGAYPYLLPALMMQDAAALRRDLIDQITLTP